MDITEKGLRKNGRLLTNMNFYFVACGSCEKMCIKNQSYD